MSGAAFRLQLVFLSAFLQVGRLSSAPIDCRWDLLNRAPSTWSVVTIAEGDITATEKALIETQVKLVLPLIQGFQSTQLVTVRACRGTCLNSYVSSGKNIYFEFPTSGEVSAEAIRFALTHEIGHTIFSEGIGSEPRRKAAFQWAQQLSKRDLPQELDVLDAKRVLERRAKEVDTTTLEGKRQYEEIQRQILEKEKEKERLNTQSGSANFVLLEAATGELFADLVSVMGNGFDGAGMKRSVLALNKWEGTDAAVPAQDLSARDFTEFKPVRTWTLRGKYSLLGPAGHWLWLRVQKHLNEKTAPVILKAVMEASLREMEHLQRKHPNLDLSPPAINTRFIESLDVVLREQGL